MVRALLEGRKTQTRRLLKPQPETFIVDGAECKVEAVHVQGDAVPRVATGLCLTSQKEPYAKGDRLYVREHWKARARMDDYAPRQLTMDPSRVAYLADGEPRGCPLGEWSWGRHRQGMHMPRWASRLTLTVTDVRIERLTAISEADAIAEGIEKYGYGSLWGWVDYLETNPNMTRCHGDPRKSFASLWESLHGPGSWDEDPLVVALTFRVERENIDRLGTGA
ncbi:hypothetical protein [Sphingomonas abietis]|uniref:ASCH domain-containing protein n=1 Tax=Sphingomonas abietis TaxID=3012344 RepID=A0ABY7NTU3_9SPHN|nr:hypothetical protein [Sphingomonas abietis]WBO23977.1 hypothetical protein PBT88_07660 [Sphingomonas abietis]